MAYCRPSKTFHLFSLLAVFITHERFVECSLTLVPERASAPILSPRLDPHRTPSVIWSPQTLCLRFTHQTWKMSVSVPSCGRRTPSQRLLHCAAPAGDMGPPGWGTALPRNDHGHVVPTSHRAGRWTLRGHRRSVSVRSEKDGSTHVMSCARTPEPHPSGQGGATGIREDSVSRVLVTATDHGGTACPCCGCENGSLGSRAGPFPWPQEGSAMREWSRSSQHGTTP